MASAPESRSNSSAIKTLLCRLVGHRQSQELSKRYHQADVEVDLEVIPEQKLIRVIDLGFDAVSDFYEECPKGLFIIFKISLVNQQRRSAYLGDSRCRKRWLSFWRHHSPKKMLRIESRVKTVFSRIDYSEQG